MVIDILLNGMPERVEEGMSLNELLVLLESDPSSARGVAIAVNDEVVRRDEWADRKLLAGDTVEIVTARQGG